jgi:hypothetical protein
MNSAYTNDATPATLAIWAAKDLSGRIDVATTAKLLGFAEHDIQGFGGGGKIDATGRSGSECAQMVRGGRDH